MHPVPNTIVKNRLIYIFRRINALLIIVTFLAYLSPYINPAVFWPTTFLGLAYPWLLLGNILFVLFWLWREKWYFLYSLGCILLGWVHLTNFIGFSFESIPPKQENELTVMSFNAYGFRYFYGKNPKYRTPYSKYSILDFYDFIKKENIDVLCLQENTHKSARDIFFKEINEVTDLAYQYKYPDRPLTILSKYPIKNKDVLKFGKIANGGHFVDIEVNGKMLRIYNIHLLSNKVSGYAKKLAEKPNLKEKETWLDIRGMMGRFKRAAQGRVEQAQIVKKHIENSPYPAILCGDFNDTPQSYIYRQLSENMKDSFQEKGRGLGVTYGGKIPGLRIDYVMINKELQVINSEIFGEDYSDHYPVIARVRWGN